MERLTDLFCEDRRTSLETRRIPLDRIAGKGATSTLATRVIGHLNPKFLTMKILLIDDDSDDRALFREVVQEISPETICATESDGEKALSDLLDPSFTLPDLIFMDINMPRISGWDCLTTIKGQEKTKNIPVVMFSTSSRDRDIDSASRYGAIGLLTKSGDYRELKRSITDVINSMNDNNTPFVGFSGYAL